MNPPQPITVQVYCRLTVTVDDPDTVTDLAVQRLRSGDIDWPAEEDDLETAAEDLGADLLNAVAGLADPHRMFSGVPGVETQGGRLWAEHGQPDPRFQPGFETPD